VHVACTEYLTLLHVGGRSSADTDHGGVLATFTGVLVRDGYAGYEHLPALHAWCGAHLLRDLRSVSEADPIGQLWATAMADTLIAAHHAATTARNAGQDRLDETTLATLLNHYLGALTKGRTDNLGKDSELAYTARTLIRRFHRHQDMILRFTTDLTIPWTNNQAERDLRPVKIQQRTSGGCWRTLTGLTEFATVHSYLATATKWGENKLEALTELFTTGPWLPPGPHAQLNSYLSIRSARRRAGWDGSGMAIVRAKSRGAPRQTPRPNRSARQVSAETPSVAGSSTKGTSPCG